MSMHSVYLALGTNLGDRAANLRAAIAAMPPRVKVVAESAIYETPPWGFTDQPPFLNMVVRAETELEPQDLLDYLKNLEKDLGRTPTFTNGPRQIDIDILFYDMLVLNTPGLVIPHPRLQERAFVVVPLADLAPDFIHPVTYDFVWEMLFNVDVTGIKPYR